MCAHSHALALNWHLVCMSIRRMSESHPVRSPSIWTSHATITIAAVHACIVAITWSTEVVITPKVVEVMPTEIVIKVTAVD